MHVDYSLYLVTDSTESLLRGHDLASIVQQAIEGGATIIQFRDKASETKDLIVQAQKLLAVTRPRGIPLLVNDRVDVALAVGAEGVHLGQDDMNLSTARSLLGPEAIIGVTCHNISEAYGAARGGADYIGIGTLFATSTKKDADNIIGIAGCRNILECLSTTTDVPTISTVAIGGINASNAQRVLYQSATPSKQLDGIAVVSAIIASDDPCAAAKQLRVLSRSPLTYQPAIQVENSRRDAQAVLQAIPAITKKLVDIGPLCHNMTNLVVQNFAANVALAIGAKPIMANDGSEAEDLSRLGGSLVINMGTVSTGSIANYLAALKAYNGRNGPVLLDPVGVGATRLRRQALQSLLDGGYFDIIKGNESEIQVVWGESQLQQRGVESHKELSVPDKAHIVKRLASRERNIVIMTGETDFLSDGDRVYSVSNGDPFLGLITGSGCTLGATIAAYAAVNREDKLIGALAGLLHYEIAAEMARKDVRVQGPGTFVPVFIDCLNKISQLAQDEDSSWLKVAKIEALES